MFYDAKLQEHLETSSSVKNKSLIVAEWNMNIPDNISMVGNYRYRKDSATYRFLPVQFLENDPAHKGATLSDVVVDNGFDVDDNPIQFSSVDKKESFYYSLDECLGKFRPRSGINKVRFFGQDSGVHFLNGTTENGLGQSFLDTNRPRYYAPDKGDKFKYWTSFRFESGLEYGVANKAIAGSAEYKIDDAVPFVVYKDSVPANRVVVKMQTNVGTVTVGPVLTEQGTIPDPLYGISNATVPVRWKIQGLVGNNWEDLKSFDSNSIRRSGKPIIGEDGYVELSYGLIVPEEYRDIFIQAETYYTASVLPIKAVNGYAYLIKNSLDDVGTYHIWIDDAQEYKTFVPKYGWEVAEETVDRFTHYVVDTTNPDNFKDTTNQFRKTFREYQELRGIRIVVDSMKKFDSTFDLIEMSTRLAVNITEKTKSVSVKKIASDLGISGLPVGQLLASTGTIEIFDYDDAFNRNNIYNIDTNTSGSIIAKYAANQIQFKIYDVTAEVLENGIYYDYFVPIKTLYGDGFPQLNVESRSVNINLRDMFSYFESFTAPQILATDASLSYAVSFLLDSIGFGNYVFKRTASESEPIIPFFYVEPDVTVADILNELARSTQTAMFFDEYNNFVMMSKNYMLPSASDRGQDLTLYGSVDSARNGVERNAKTKSKLANIISIASQDTEVYNDGKINFTTRYIQKSYSSIEQANKLDRDKKWTYKPSLLWEVSPSEATKGQNEEDGSLSVYSLTAIPLKTDLSEALPKVNNKGEIINNIIDFGDAAFWMGRYAGYFYANGEIIRYDAVEYSVLGGGTSTAWISSLEEYQYYFSKIPFNGKMYPTGRVRIYAKPFYSKETGLPLQDNVEVHGRGQFGTSVVAHKAGISGSEWTTNVSGVTMDADYIFSAIGNFQLRDGYVPYKATIPLQFFGSGSNNWTLSGPGTLSKTSGTAVGASTDSSVSTNIRSEKEHSYSLSIAGTKVYEVSQKLKDQYNVDNKTLLGEMYVKNVQAGTTAGTSKLTLSVTLPSYRSFFKDTTTAGKSPSGSFSWSIVGAPVTGGNYGTIKAGKKTVKDKKGNNVIQDDATKTKIYQGESTTAMTPTSGTETSANLVIDLVVDNVSRDTLNPFWLIVGTNTDPVRTIQIKPGTVSGVIKPLTTKEVAYNNRTIHVEDTSGIKVGQSLKLGKKETIVSGSESKIVNPFDVDNSKNLRVASIIDENKFTIKHKGDAQGGISTANLGKDMETLTFEELRTLTSNPEIKAGSQTNLSGKKNSSTLAAESTRTGVMKNFLSTNSGVDDTGVANPNTIPQGSVQSSALILSGPSFTNADDPESVNFISYAYKELSKTAKYKYFGTRLRLVGRYDYGSQQSGVGEEVWYTNKQLSASGLPGTGTTVKASSAGMAIMLNPKTNNGYYFEIAAVSDTGVAKQIVKYSDDGKQIEDPIHNLLFYKMNAGVDEDGALLDKDKATPVKLWGGFTNILVDDGLLTGQARMTSTSIPNTVYDIAVEYEIVNENHIKFYLYVNNILVGTVTDKEPFLDSASKPIIYNNMGLFVRGKAKAMFENVFAMGANPSQNRGTDVVAGGVVNGVFSEDSINLNESMKKYALSGIIPEKYLSGIDSATPASSNLYYDEFGTIMREVAYFNVRYDKSYPALVAQIAPTYNNNRGFFVSGFIAGPYSAEFLVFNATDSVLYLDGSGGNYLRINGITFTQQSTHELTVDEYFALRSSLSDPQTPVGSDLVKSPLKEAQEYNVIRNSRSAYGKKEFTLDSRYIQSQDYANGLMGWLIGKIMKPRKSVGVTVFSMPTIQLGDIVSIDMVDSDGKDMVAPSSSRFVVYQIDYEKSSEGPSMSVYLSEVV